MVGKFCRSAMLVAAIASVPLAVCTILAGAAYAQTAPTCLTVPASGTVTCVDEFGNPVTQFVSPALSVPPAPDATLPTPSMTSTPVTEAAGTEGCFPDPYGNLVCPAEPSPVSLSLPTVVSPQQPLDLQPGLVILEP